MPNFLSLLPGSMAFSFPSICLGLCEYLHSKFSYDLWSLNTRFSHYKYSTSKGDLDRLLYILVFDFRPYQVGLHRPNLSQPLFSVALFHFLHFRITYFIVCSHFNLFVLHGSHRSNVNPFWKNFVHLINLTMVLRVASHI